MPDLVAVFESRLASLLGFTERDEPSEDHALCEYARDCLLASAILKEHDEHVAAFSIYDLYSQVQFELLYRNTGADATTLEPSELLPYPELCSIAEFIARRHRAILTGRQLVELRSALMGVPNQSRPIQLFVQWASSESLKTGDFAYVTKDVDSHNGVIRQTTRVLLVKSVGYLHSFSLSDEVVTLDLMNLLYGDSIAA